MAENVLLIVDDEESICRLIKSILENWALKNRISLMTARNLKTVMEIFENRDNHVSVMITDQIMPELNGTDLIKTVAEKYPDTVPVLMTGFSHLDNIEEIIDAGLFAFIKKPWERQKLIDTADRALKFSFLKNITQEQEKLLKEDLLIASEFQKVFLKVPIPSSPLMHVELTHRCANDLYFGGDYYDIFNLGNDEYFFMLGDVAGHGLKASFFTAILKATIFSEYIKNNVSITPAFFLEWLNKRVVTVLRNTPDLFMAFSAGLLKAREKKLIFSNAGQPPLLLAADGKLVKTAIPEIAIGVDEDMVYSETEIDLDTGSLIIMCTDGIYPAGKSSNSFSETDFEDLLISESGKTEGFNEAVMNFIYNENKSGNTFDDDATLLSIRIK